MLVNKAGGFRVSLPSLRRSLRKGKLSLLLLMRSSAVGVGISGAVLVTLCVISLMSEILCIEKAALGSVGTTFGNSVKVRLSKSRWRTGLLDGSGPARRGEHSPGFSASA